MKRTKAAFLSSFMSVILCFTMLIGSTFAWFTDTASNTGNRIQAGNLQIDLLMDKEGNGTYTSIKNGKGDIFATASNATNSNATLWEPGKTQVVYLGVQNKGNLALKYQFYLDVKDHGLCDDGSGNSALEYIIVPNGKSDNNVLTTDYATIKATATSEYPNINIGDVKPGRTVMTNTGVLDEIAKGTSNETEYFALVVHMKEDAGNVYQDKDAVIDVYLTATQKDAEEDGFGTDEYDKQADYAEKVAEPVEDTVTKKVVENQDTVMIAAAAPANETGKQTKVTFPKEIKEFAEAATAGKETTMTVKADTVIAANNKFTISSDGAVGAIDLEVKVNDQPVTSFKDKDNNDVPVIVETYVAKNLTNVTLQYNNGLGAQPTNVIYDKTTGKLSWKTTHFSTFVLGADEVAYVTENNTAYKTLEEAAEYADEKNVHVALLKDIDYSNKYGANEFNCFIFENDVVDLNGYSISNKNGSIVFDGDNMLIKNGEFIGTNEASYGLFVGDGIYEDRISEGVILEDLEFVGGINIMAAEVTIREMIATTTASAKTYYAVWGDEAARVTVESGTFKSESTKGGKVIHAYNGGGEEPGEPALVTIKGGNYIALNDGVQMFGEGKDFIKVQGGTFNRDPSGNVVEGYKAVDNGDGTWTVVKE